jgi:hypothetical protein
MSGQFGKSVLTDYLFYSNNDVHKYMKKFKITGYTNRIGSFMVVGTDHSYNAKDATLTVVLEDDGRKIYTQVISFESSSLPETASDKIVRLEKEIVELENQLKGAREESRNKSKKAEDIYDLCAPSDIPRFGKKKLFAKIRSIAQDIRW